jgi:hypothetical protein
VKDRAPHREPERLARNPVLGTLLERANGGYRSGLDEAAAFQRLSERLEPPRRQRVTWQRVTVGAALSFAAGVAFVLEVPREQPSLVAFGPEIPTSRRPATEGSDGVLRESAPPEVGATLEASPAVEKTRSLTRTLERGQDDHEGAPRDGALREPRSESVRDPHAPRSTQVLPDEGSRTEKQIAGPLGSIDIPADRVRGDSAPTSVARAVENRVDCLDMARQGEPRAAESCFAARASGTGLSAEMALYEMARLRRDVLRDGNGALGALDEYRRRFPQGSLRHEVSITRVELLSDLGRSREALSESEALLQSASGQERAAELHVLRGNVFRRDLSDWRSAAAEYAKAEALGGALAPEATRLRGMSLEGMGDVAGAVGAYQRYLGGGDVPRKAEVTRRLEGLLAARAAAGAAHAPENRKP